MKRRQATRKKIGELMIETYQTSNGRPTDEDGGPNTLQDETYLDLLMNLVPVPCSTTNNPKKTDEDPVTTARQDNNQAWVIHSQDKVITKSSKVFEKKEIRLRLT